MYFLSKIATFLVPVLFGAVSTSQGLPIHFGARTVYNPPITSPKAGDGFNAGITTLVRWDITKIPPNTANPGQLILGHGGNGGENLDINHPLAQGFKLTAGSQSVTFSSDLPPRSDYFLVLMGDSGNKSPEFTIKSSS